MNLPTLFVSALIAIIFGAIILRGIYNRKHGKSSCSCGCSQCRMSDICHKKKD